MSNQSNPVVKAEVYVGAPSASSADVSTTASGLEADLLEELEGLLCIKCGDHTTMLDSRQSGGRNALKRVCKGCTATDKALDRRCNPPCLSQRRALDDNEGASGTPTKKKPRTATAEEMASAREEQAEGKKVRSAIAKMSSTQRMEWYRNEKANRQAAEGATNTNRSFNDTKAVVEQIQDDKTLDDELDQWETQEDFCLRQLALKRAETEQGAILLWREAVKAPGANVKKARGELLLGRFTGLGRKKRNEDGLRTRLGQGQTIESHSDLEEFGTLADKMKKKMKMQQAQERLPEGKVDDSIPLDEVHIQGKHEWGEEPQEMVLRATVLRQLQEKAQAEQQLEEQLREQWDAQVAALVARSPGLAPQDAQGMGKQS